MEGNHLETSSLDAWELSKENVLPLKQGRKITNLTAALQPQNVDRQQQLILQRQGFETELRAYAGDDPLDPWVRYIQWTEQNFPQGGKDSHLGILMQKCLIQFKHDDRYKQDPRYVAIWLKMAQSESESLEIYKFMQANQIGTQLTIFYEAWAWELEQLGNTKKADMIYKEGLSLNAQPRDRLERSLIEFQSRVGRATMHQLQEGMMNPSAAEDQRIKLGDLRARGKYQKVGPNRTGAATLSSRGGLGVAPAPLQQRGNKISIFCDDDANAAGGLPSSKPAASSEWQHLPSRSEAQKENTQAAGQWKGQRLPQRNIPGMTFQEVGSLSKPSFDVHVDANAEQITTPHKPVEMGHQVLSERKPSKPANVLQQFQKESSNDNSRVMYCKHLIYGGAREMSFEELRAIKHSNKRKERELQAKEAAIRQREEMLLKKQEEQQDMFVKFQEELQQQRMMHQQLIDMLIKQKQEPGAQPDSSSGQLQQAQHPSQVLGNQPPTSQPPPQIPPTSMQQYLAPPTSTQHQLHPQPPAQALTQPMQQQQHVLPSQAPPVSAQPPSCIPEQDVPMETGHGIPGGPFEEQQKAPCADQASPQQPMDTLANNHVPKGRTRSNSGDSTFACTQQLVFDDLTATAVSGGFNIFCDREQTQAPKSTTCQSAGSFGPVSQPATVTANTLSGTQSLSVANAAPSTTILTETIHCRPDTVTPNQSIYLNTSADPNTTATDNKTPLANLSASSSNKTPSSTSAAAGAHYLSNRLSSIRTPKGLTAPSPTINTKEALGVINAMLNSSLESNMFGLGDLSIRDVPSQDKEFEMEFANTETKDEDNEKMKTGFIFEDNSSAFTQVGGFAGHGIVPRRQPLAVRPAVTLLQQPTLPPASSTAHTGGRVPFGERKPLMASTVPGYPQPCSVSSAAPSSLTAAPATDMDAHCSSGIPVYDENVDVRGGGEKIKIFEDEPGNTKENTPPSDYRQEEMKREMAGILQSSKSIPFEPLEDDVPAAESAMVTDAGNASHQLMAPPADPLASSQHMNATLAPSSGNHSFEVAARMASTPFNNASQYGQLSFIPPMSTIKPREVEQTLLGASLGPVTEGLSHQVPTETRPIPGAGSVSGSGLASRVVAHPVNDSFEKTEYTANHSGGPLSPIMETSNENVRSSASSSSSSSNSHTSLECSHPPASASCAEDKPEPTPVPTASGFSIHVDQDEPMVSDAQPQEQLPPPSPVAPHSMLGAPLQHEASMLDRSQHSRMEGPQDESTRRVSLLQKDDLPALECSFIPDRTLVDVSAVLEQSMMAAATGVEESPDFKDPFNFQLQSSLLANLSKPLTMYKGFYQHEQEMPDIQPGLAVNFGDEINVYNVNKKVGEGAFATIYLAGCLDAQDITDLDYEDRKVVLKVQRPPCPWEFYIVKELHARLSRLPSQVDVRPCLMSADCAHVYADSSCLVTEYHRNGTLLDFINTVRSVSGDAMQENWVILFTIEILQIVDFMHRCNIIHGDIKPDNFLIANFAVSDNVTCSHDTSNLLKLIDMGRSIDMRLFPEGTTFTAKCNTSGFNCTEMQSGRPWTYQVDYYGIAGTVHCLLFGSYMKVYQEGGQWKMTSNIHRRARANWKHFFHTLLNVPSCDPADQPSLADLRRGLEQLVNLPLDKGRMKMNMEIMLT
ncbi:uncharacterized protein [Diadema setosum]|uniref:uncharacterized protein n=1 Tax=Diadema setosum TaxID=31175 RepID=UPI003B3A318C